MAEHDAGEDALLLEGGAEAAGRVELAVEGVGTFGTHVDGAHAGADEFAPAYGGEVDMPFFTVGGAEPGKSRTCARGEMLKLFIF